MAVYVRSDVAIGSGQSWDMVDRYAPVSSPAPISGASGKIVLSNTDGTFTLIEGIGFAFAGAQFLATAGTVTSVKRITAATFTPSAGETLETLSGLSYSLVSLSGLLTQNNSLFPSTLLSGADTLTGGSGADKLKGFGGADVIDGGANADEMIGGAGNDTYYVDNFGDRVIEDASSGIDTVRVSALVAYSLGANVERLEFLSSGNNVGFGNSLNNRMVGNAGNDTLVGDAGNDALIGGGGADTLIGGIGDDTYYVDDAGDVISELFGQGTDTVIASNTAVMLSADVEKLTYNNGVAADQAFSGTGNAVANTITGGEAGDTLSGLGGSDSLFGGGGSDTLTGGAGNDVLDGGSGADNLDGGGEADRLRGVLVDGTDDSAVDTLVGGGGDDTFFAGVGDIVTEADGGGKDLIFSAVAAWDLAAQAFVEGLAYDNGAAADAGFTGSGNALANGLTGGSANDILAGRDGDDTLSGGLGNDLLRGDDDADGRDLLYGGAGNDTYYISHAGDLVTEKINEGFDLVFITDNISTSSGGGLRALTGNGSVLAYTMRDNVEALVYGSKASVLDPFVGGSQAFSLAGNALANVILGGVQSDELNGGAGADILAGGLGNDTYVVDSANDRVYEGSFLRNGELWRVAASGGIDEVRSLANVYSLAGSDAGYAGGTLKNEIENLTFIGAGNFAGYGNDYANNIRAGSGNDYLDGAGGADTLRGGAGDDTYVITAADSLVELSNGGTDTIVVSEVTFSLGASQFANVENMTYDNGNVVLFAGDDDPLNDDAFFTGIGNALNNRLTGGYNTDSLYGEGGADLLDGRGGADNMVGGTGNDTYVVDHVRDRISEVAGGGTGDTVITSLGTYALGSFLEHLTYAGSDTFFGYGNAVGNRISGGSGRDVLSGRGGADTLFGNGGNDILAGGDGADYMAGGSGSDTFLFNTAIGTTIDRIADFSVAADTIRLENTGIFTKLAVGTLKAENFKVGAVAGDANDYIIYNKATGALYYDADGNGGGAAVQFALVLNKASLSNLDIVAY